jgi:hypothetical protein
MTRLQQRDQARRRRRLEVFQEVRVQLRAALASLIPGQKVILFGFEQMCLRVAKAFENSIDDEKGRHGALLNRLSIAIPGVRPALVPQDLKPPLTELRGFRHVMVHAYDLTLDPDKLALVLKYARQVAERLPAAVDDFVRNVAKEQQIEL